MPEFTDIETLRARIGAEIGVSRWFTIDQDRIDRFAGVSEDHQFIHLDPVRAAAETVFGGTVAHGFLTLALLSAMSYDALPQLAGTRASVNYGFDRVRFVAPVRAGARIRGRFTLAALDQTAPDEVTLHWAVTVEIEGQDKPAVVADWISRRYLDAAPG